MHFEGILSLWVIESEGGTDTGQIAVVATKEHELTVVSVQLLSDAAHQWVSDVDGSSMGGEEQCVVDLFHLADVSPLLCRQLMTEGSHALILVALQHQSISHAVGQCIAASHPGFVVFLYLELRVVIPEVQGVALQCSRRVSHVEYLFHQRQRGLHTLHPCLWSAFVFGFYLVEYLLAVLVVHLRELRLKHGVHLVLCQFVCNLHIGKGQETSREIFRCCESALT